MLVKIQESNQWSHLEHKVILKFKENDTETICGHEDENPS